MSKENIFRILTAVCISFLMCAAALAQATDNGGLEGTVYDPNAAAVPNATVTVKNLKTGLTRTVTTNGEGRWKVTVLPLGDYEVRAEAEGFVAGAESVTVLASTSNVVDVFLSVSGVDPAIVDVSVSEGSEVITNDNSSTTAFSISGKKLEEVPLVNRSAFSRTVNDTSVSGDINDPLAAGTGNPEISVHGTRTTSSSVLVQGVDATPLVGTGSLSENIAPSPESVQEVKLLSSLYDASLGRSGGGSFQVAFRSGGNQFNGSAYAYFQNEIFNANDFFYNRDGIDRQVARRFEGGFTLGGPIIKDKFFFFGSYQRTDAKSAYVSSASSFVVLPEALAFITDRSNPESVRQAFLQSVNMGGVGTAFTSASCIRPLTSNSPNPNLACIDPTGIGFRLLNLRNPITGGYIIPTLTPGRYERLYVDSANSQVFVNGVRVTDFSAYGLPNGLPLLDATFQGGIVGGLPLVRFRNVFPAEFEQDQVATRFDYNIAKGNDEGLNRNDLTVAFFYADFPSFNPFSDDTVISPTPLIRDDKNRTLSVTNTHIFSSNLINEARFGFFYLDNSRKLDDRLITDELSNSGLGVINPATLFAPGAPSNRPARIAGTGNLSDLSINAPNDVFNRRKQVTMTFADNLTYLAGDHTFRFGAEYKRNAFDTNLPEEQGVEFEGLINFTQLLTSYVPEVDVSLGITDKQFRFNDLSFYASDDWRFSDRLTLNIGLRWDWFGLPYEKNGRFANFDFSRLTSTEDIRSGFVLPGNVEPTGFSAIDESLGTIARSDTKHTLNGQDLNNFAPRVGFAFKPFKSDTTVIRGGYGIFYDRPSAAFINTIYSNYPFFKDIEVKTEFRPRAVYGPTALSVLSPTRAFSSYFPFTVGVSNIADASPYILLDNTPGVSIANGAEPLEFRAIDPDLKTPMVQQWNIGIQQQFGDWTIEARYVGTKGQNLLLAVGFNQPYDLNDPNTPDYIYGRLNDALERLFPGILPPRQAGLTERERGLSTAANTRTFGACNLAYAGVPGYAPCNGGLGGVDLNLSSQNFDDPRAIISADLRVPFLGFDPTDAIVLRSAGYSNYHSGQLNVARRLSRGLTFNASYTFSKSIDIGSTDPGSTAASGRPDTANLGLVVQGDQRDLNSNKAVSDFDRTHRFSSSFTYDIPNFGLNSKFATGWQISGSGQWQSGAPFSIFATNADFFPQASGGAFLLQYLGIVSLVTERRTPLGGTFREATFNVGAGSGTIFNTAFGRPSVRSLQLLMRQGDDITRAYFNTCQDPNNAECALLAPLGGFGNLPRNALRGPSQKRVDLSIQKTTKFFSEKMELQLKWDIFNVFNFVNFANPNADLSDETDFGQITRTVGSPRVMQFGAKVRF